MDLEGRLAELWASLGDRMEGEFLAAMDELVSGLPPDSPVRPFELASAQDSTGHSDKAVPLYQRALELGLDGERRSVPRSSSASSLRNIGPGI